MAELERAVEIAWNELEVALQAKDRRRYSLLRGLWLRARARLESARYEADFAAGLVD